jgi:hypothetical protein
MVTKVGKTWQALIIILSPGNRNPKINFVEMRSTISDIKHGNGRAVVPIMISFVYFAE